MYIFNQSIAEVVKTRGYATKEDFTKLKNDKSFVAWRDGEDVQIETVLDEKGIKKSHDTTC